MSIDCIQYSIVVTTSSIVLLQIGCRVYSCEQESYMGVKCISCWQGPGQRGQVVICYAGYYVDCMRMRL